MDKGASNSVRTSNKMQCICVPFLSIWHETLAPFCGVKSLRNIYLLRIKRSPADRNTSAISFVSGAFLLQRNDSLTTCTLQRIRILVGLPLPTSTTHSPVSTVAPSASQSLSTYPRHFPIRVLRLLLKKETGREQEMYTSLREV